MRVYYSDHDSYCAAWLRNLVREGLIPDGKIDQRDIADVKPADLADYQQHHFFAGIAGWARALELAGWPAEWPVWTGSAPCQPFSVAGEHKADADSRDLWPTWFGLIRQCRPPIIFGEQVAEAIGFGWWDRICVDLEGENYACAAAVLPACGVGAPIRRVRLYWVAQSGSTGLEGLAGDGAEGDQQGRERTQPDRSATTPGAALSDASGVDEMHLLRGLPLYDSRRARSGLRVPADRRVGDDAIRGWEQYEQLPCADGWRRIGPGLFPLAPRISARVDKLRAAGNAIVPQIAAEFIRAAMTTSEYK